MESLNLKYLIIFLLALPFNLSAYYPLSPYSYCAGSPVNIIDPTGCDIVVLNYGNDMSHQHLALLIQDENGKWEYYSINGNNVYIPSTDIHTGGRLFNDIAVGSWETPQDFLNSTYNQKTANSKDDPSMNNFGFEEGYQISTTPEQDEAIRNEFIKLSKTDYNLLSNNCATIVQRAMIEGGIPVSEPTFEPVTIPISTQYGLMNAFNGYKMKCDINIIPSIAFDAIIKWNPGGTLIHK